MAHDQEYDKFQDLGQGQVQEKDKDNSKEKGKGQGQCLGHCQVQAKMQG